MRWFVRVLLFVVLLFSIALYSANFLLLHYAENHKAEIEGLLTSNLKTKVEFSSILPQLFPYPQLSAENILISLDSENQEVLKINQLKLELELQSLITDNLKFKALDLKISEHNLSLQHGKVNFKDIHLKADLNFSDNKLNLKNISLAGKLNNLDFIFTSDNFIYSNKTQFLEIKSSKFSSLRNLVLFDLEFNLNTKQTNFVTPEFLFQPADFISLTKVLLPQQLDWLRQGVVSGSINYLRNSELDYKLDGDLKLVNVKHKKNISIESAQLNKLNIQAAGAEAVRVKSGVLMSKVNISSLDTNYSASKISGDLNLNNVSTGSTTIDGTLNLSGFAYNDGTTAVSDVTGSIEPLNITFKKNTDIESVLNIKATSLKLNHESVKVHSAKKIDCQMSMKIPAKADYKVNADISVLDGDVETIGHRFNKLHGSLRMFLSTPEKTFTSNLLSFEESKRQGNLKANLKIVPKLLQVLQAETNFFGGRIEASASLGREDNQQFAAKITAANAEIPKLKNFLVREPKEESYGQIDSLNLDLKGNRNLFPKSITGSGAIAISQPEAARTGIARNIMNGLQSVPVVGPLFGSKKIAEASERQTLSSKLVFANNRCNFENAKLSRQSYELNAGGSLDPDFNLDLRGEVIMLQETASNLGLGIKPLGNLFGRAGRIVIPVYIRGKLPEYKVEADLTTFLKNNSGITLGENIIRGIGSRVLPDKNNKN